METSLDISEKEVQIIHLHSKTLPFGEKIVKIGPADPEIIVLREIIKLKMHGIFFVHLLITGAAGGSCNRQVTRTATQGEMADQRPPAIITVKVVVAICDQKYSTKSLKFCKFITSCIHKMHNCA